MKRIGNSKEPTPKRMLAISTNLRDILKTSVFLDLTAKTYDHTNDTSTGFTLWIENERHFHFKTWPDVLEYYRKRIADAS